jgi:hypothetical protein
MVVFCDPLQPSVCSVYSTVSYQMVMYLEPHKFGVAQTQQLVSHHYSVSVIILLPNSACLLLVMRVLILFSTVNVWKVSFFVSCICASSVCGPDMNTLTPPWKKLRASCVLHATHVNYVTSGQTGGRLTMLQTWCQSPPTNLQSAKPPAEYTFLQALWS